MARNGARSALFARLQVARNAPGPPVQPQPALGRTVSGGGTVSMGRSSSAQRPSARRAARHGVQAACRAPDRPAGSPVRSPSAGRLRLRVSQQPATRRAPVPRPAATPRG